MTLGSTIEIKRVEEIANKGVFEIDGLYAGYGLTLGNALRRVLLSSIPGAAITQIKIKGVGHEFSTIPNVKEDVVEIELNLKKVRFQMFTAEPQILTLKVKGEALVAARDIQESASVVVVSKDAHIATLTAKNADLEIEMTVERGLGYVPVEARKTEKLAIGVVALDAFFSPVTKVSFAIENMRVGDRIDYNRLRFVIETDGSISPSKALKFASDTLREHFEKVGTLDVQEFESEHAKEAVVKKTKKHESKKSE